MQADGLIVFDNNAYSFINISRNSTDQRADSPVTFTAQLNLNVYQRKVKLY